MADDAADKLCRKAVGEVRCEWGCEACSLSGGERCSAGTASRSAVAKRALPKVVPKPELAASCHRFGKLVRGLHGGIGVVVVLLLAAN